MSADPNKRRFAKRAHGLVGRLRRGTDGREFFPSDTADGDVAALLGARTNRRPLLVAGVLTLLAVSAGLIASNNLAQGKGGTAKPPPGAVSPFTTPTLPDPAFSVDPRLIHGFDMTGFLQNATVSNTRCPNESDADRYGGTVTINNTKITVPCGIVIQMPANTFRWAEFVNAGDLSLGSIAAGKPAFEMSVVGNTVGTENIAGLMYFSQQSLNGGSGVISKIDYSNGRIEVDTGNAGSPSVLEINDPQGRFGRVQSPDPRLSVDDENPTIHAATGFPMCVPRTTTNPTVAGNPDDALCPQANRPKPANGQCRNFGQAGVNPLPASGELSIPAAGQAYCSQYVMPAPGAAGPDARQQAPFEVGDFIAYSGTLMTDANGKYISAHTIEANVGIYTQPGTQPSYLAIGEFGVGTADPNATAANGAAQETQDRLFLEAETTDIKTPVDIYMVDVNPVTGVETNRWTTPFEMTGENQLGNPSGGITTQFTGPQPQRARIRATKAPTGLLSQPTRNVRVMARSRCLPPLNNAQTSAALDACVTANQANTVANGLAAGMYSAPVFEYIFPENVKPGDPIVPNDLWHLPFVRNGEGPTPGDGVGALVPTPW
jgi:hypothetical protein